MDTDDANGVISGVENVDGTYADLFGSAAGGDGTGEHALQTSIGSLVAESLDPNRPHEVVSPVADMPPEETAHTMDVSQLGGTHFDEDPSPGDGILELTQTQADYTETQGGDPADGSAEEGEAHDVHAEASDVVEPSGGASDGVAAMDEDEDEDAEDAAPRPSKRARSSGKREVDEEDDDIFEEPSNAQSVDVPTEQAEEEGEGKAGDAEAGGEEARGSGDGAAPMDEKEEGDEDGGQAEEAEEAAELTMEQKIEKKILELIRTGDTGLTMGHVKDQVQRTSRLRKTAPRAVEQRTLL